MRIQMTRLASTIGKVTLAPLAIIRSSSLTIVRVDHGILPTYWRLPSSDIAAPTSMARAKEREQLGHDSKGGEGRKTEPLDGTPEFFYELSLGSEK